MGTVKDLTQRRRARSSGQDPHLLFQRGDHRRTSTHICSTSFGPTGRECQPRAHQPARLLLRPLAAAGAWSKIKGARFPLNDGIGVCPCSRPASPYCKCAQ
jgi:hypothetical protein